MADSASGLLQQITKVWFAFCELSENLQKTNLSLEK